MRKKRKDQTIGFKKIVKAGRAKKRYGPKENRPKKYKGQGRTR